MVLVKNLRLSIIKINFSSKVITPMTAHIPVTEPFAESTALKYLKCGSVIAIPTDTVYGLACDATNTSAINKLYSVKCRDESKPLAISLGKVSDVEKWAYVQHLPRYLLTSLLPGPVTLILPSAGNKLDKSLTLNGKIGVRVPNYTFTRHLACDLDTPLALTSANLSNERSAVIVLEFRSLWDKISAVFDGGNLGSKYTASTIVDLSEPGSYLIVREGVAGDETVSVLREFGLKSRFK